MNRGRKPQPCPSYDELWRYHIEGLSPTEIAELLGRSYKAVIRWLGDLGIEHVTKKVRPRGVVPAFVKVARLPSGRRVWTKLYGVWGAMKGRCYSPGTKDYKRYGARGVRMCVEWHDFETFRTWALSHGFRKGLTIDRVDSNGNYEPENCRWISKGEQQANIRRAIKLTLNGETRSLYRWARVVGMSADLLRTRHYNGWTDEHTLTIPVGGSRPAAFLQRRGRKPRIAACSSEHT
jgi:hypothetical protein